MHYAEVISYFGIRLSSLFLDFGKWSQKSYLVSFDSFRFRVRTASSDRFILHEIFHKKEYGDSFSKNDVVVDLGANIGGFSVYVAPKVKKVYSYEPHRESFSLLKENLLMNKIQNVEVCPYAVAGEKGRVTLHVGNANVGGTSMYRKWYSGKKEKVPAITLTDIFAKHKLKKVDFLKIDVEGAEYDILFSTPKKELAKVQTIALEFHDTVEKKYTYKDLVSFLEKNGFAVKVTTPRIFYFFFRFGNLNATKK